MISLDEAREAVRKRLSPQRYQHSLGVEDTAAKLAIIHGADEFKARLAGILHDYAKGIDPDRMVSMAEEFGIPLLEEDRLVPDLLHAPLGAELVKRDLGLGDQEILSAISSHTMGNLDMSSLDKIIFLADMIEPGRDYPLLGRLACLCESDLDAAMLFGLDLTIRYCLDQGRILHPQTVAVRNQVLRLLPGKIMC